MSKSTMWWSTVLTNTYFTQHTHNVLHRIVWDVLLTEFFFLFFFFCRLFGTKCNACFQSIPSSELVMRALSNVYHLRCFTCVTCDQQLKKGDEFVLKENRLYCKEDYTKEHTVDTQKGTEQLSLQYPTSTIDQTFVGYQTLHLWSLISRLKLFKYR